jgi:CBS domain-containing protein
MIAANVMTFGAASIRPDAPIEEAAHLMLQHRISGLPVIDERGELVGMVTEGDLLRRQEGGTGQDRPRWLELVLGSGKSGGPPHLAHLATVADIMSRPAVSVSENTPVHQIVETMQRLGIKRVPVVSDGKVIGIVSRADLLRGLARQAEDMPSASAEDRSLRQRVLDAMAKEPRTAWTSVNVTVKDGRVELRGATTDANLRTRLVAAARGVPGVTSLDDHMVVVGAASGRI